ncbi:mixed lineage kinase domain-like protein [Oryzias latipes]|uniref:Protein kinase domain-containing protein n=1 Tax=Oryzias latipes TaxID=8090 RepID=H2ME00_ORYLA|nr:mixed lineage kinase domain-like protein [Oryzias latipes]XP_011480341.1 mixed lineage kinase domain-like protein [Oryzias latipes]
MESIEPILSIVKGIYDHVEGVKANEKRSRRICERVKALEKIIRSIQTPKKVFETENVKNIIKDLTVTLNATKNLLEKHADSNWMKRAIKKGYYEEEFNHVNERLNDAFQALSLALNIEHEDAICKVFDKVTQQMEDEEDKKKDEEELLDKMTSLQNDVAEILSLLKTQKMPYDKIRKIKLSELKFIPDIPKKPFMTTESAEVFMGEFQGFPVAIKKYLKTGQVSSSEVETIFKKETDTMNRFQSPNILRLFGICIINENSPQPEFLVVMEYCEKGSLRQVLDSDCELSWTRKARMCLDVAQGIYRLHQAEQNFKVHGSISSNKLLVDEAYRVKLGGFELSKTETSLQRSVKKTALESTLCYGAPEMLDNLNKKFTKECEIYSIGIVLWEIATRKKPFEGLKEDLIYQKVWTEKYQEPLPTDCPENLQQMIIACRAHEPFDRPSAGVLMDKLRLVVAQLEE